MAARGFLGRHSVTVAMSAVPRQVKTQTLLAGLCFLLTASQAAAALAAGPSAAVTDPPPKPKRSVKKAKTPKRTIGLPSTRRQKAAKRAVAKEPHLDELVPPDQLPAEAVPKPNNYELRYVGMSSTNDANYTAWSAVVLYDAQLAATAKVLPSADAAGIHAAATGGPDSHHVANLGLPQQALLVTAVVAKGAAHTQRMAQLQDLANTATSLSNQNGYGPFEAQAMFQYVAEELGLDDAGDTSCHTTFFDAEDLHGVYSTPEVTLDGLSHKVTVNHTVGGKSVALRFNVPAHLPPRARVDLAVNNLDFSSLLASDVWEYKVKLRLCIKGECAIQELAPGQYTVPATAVRRLLLNGRAPLVVSAKTARRRRSGPNCPPKSNRKCRWERKARSNRTRWTKIDFDLKRARAKDAVLVLHTQPKKPTSKSREIVGQGGARFTMVGDSLPLR